MLPWILSALFASLTLGLVLRDLWRRFARARVARRRARRAIREQEAEKLLERAGYRLLERQAERRWTIESDGEPVEIDLRADLLVSRRGRTYVADVKTGGKAPSIRSAATRRQLLEYHVAYDTDGVLLVDMEARAIHVIEFGLELAPRRLGAAWWLAGLLAACAALWLGFR